MQLVPARILFAGVLVISESPLWLIHSSKRDHSIKTFAKIRGLPADHPYIVEEVYQIDQENVYQQATIGMGFLALLKVIMRNKKMQWRLFPGTSMFL